MNTQKYIEVHSEPNNKDFFNRWFPAMSAVIGLRRLFQMVSAVTEIYTIHLIVESNLSYLNKTLLLIVSAIISILAVWVLEGKGLQLLSTTIDNLLKIEFKKNIASKVMILIVGSMAGAIYYISLNLSDSGTRSNIETQIASVGTFDGEKYIGLEQGIRQRYNTQKNKSSDGIEAKYAGYIEDEKAAFKSKIKIKEDGKTGYKKTLEKKAGHEWATNNIRRIDREIEKLKQEMMATIKGLNATKDGELAGIYDKSNNDMDSEIAALGVNKEMAMAKSNKISEASSNWLSSIGFVLGWLIYMSVGGTLVLKFCERLFIHEAGIIVSYIAVPCNRKRLLNLMFMCVKKKLEKRIEKSEKANGIFNGSNGSYSNGSQQNTNAGNNGKFNGNNTTNVKIEKYVKCSYKPCLKMYDINPNSRKKYCCEKCRVQDHQAKKKAKKIADDAAKKAANSSAKAA